MRALRRHMWCVAIAVAGCAILPGGGRAITERWAFVAPSDALSVASARAHGAALDGIILDVIALDTVSALPLVQFGDSLATSVPSRQRMALITSFVGGQFHPSVVRRLAVDSTALKRTSASIAERLARLGLRGAVIDFGGMAARDSALTRSVLVTLAGAIRAASAGPVVVAIPGADTSGYPARLFERSADLLLLKLYEERTATSPSGPISTPDRIRRTLALRVSESGASRIVAALPVHGFLWPGGRTPAALISFEAGRRLAAEAGVAVERDPATSSLRATRPGSNGWELWLTDATLLAALEREVTSLNIRRIAYWRLGLEDPAIWADARR